MRRGGRDGTPLRAAARGVRARRAAAALSGPLPLVTAAAVAGVVWPSRAFAARSDLLLGLLVLAVGLELSPRRLWAVRSSWRQLLLLVVLPPALLAPIAVGLSRLFAEPERSGLVALGLAPTEVAAAALVALAGGDAALTIAVVAVSLLGSALAAPALAPLLSGASVQTAPLLGRFALIVLAPLACAVGLRLGPGTERLAAPAARAAAPLLATLVYAALGGLGDRSQLARALLAAALFLIASLAAAAIVAALPLRLLPRGWGFPFVLRDFAVAVVLAARLGHPGAAATAAVYGVLMLVAGAAAAARSGRAA